MRIFPAQQSPLLMRPGMMSFGSGRPPGSTDREVLARAARDERILLTFDKDFGELAKATALPAQCGVVLVRLPMPQPGDVGQRLAHAIISRSDWAGHFSVVEPGRVRMRPLAR